MNYKEEVEKIDRLDSEAKGLYSQYKAINDEIDEIKKTMIKDMRENGVARVEAGKYQVVVAKRKSLDIVNQLQVINQLKSWNVPEDSYKCVNMSDVKKIVKDKIKAGESVEGVDTVEKDYISFKTKKNE